MPLPTPFMGTYIGWRPACICMGASLDFGFYKYWTRVAELPHGSLTRKALSVQRQLLAAGHPCWLLNFRQQLVATPQAAGFWEDWWARGEDPGFQAVTSRVEGSRVVHVPWAEDLREAFTQAADDLWRGRVQAVEAGQGEGGNKLRTYARFKADITQEAYLSTNMRSSARKLLCRFRVGVAPLQIELGRRQGRDGSRSCPVCGAEVEDEEHFLMACPLYDELRRDLLQGVTGRLRASSSSNRHLLRRWIRATQAQRFDILMSLDGKDDIKALADHLVQAWDLRAVFLSQMAEPAGPLSIQDPLAVVGEGGVDRDSATDSELVLEP